MMSVRTATWRRSALHCGCALGAVTWIAIGSASAQSGDAAKATGSPAPAAAASQNGPVDLDALPTAGATPPAAATAASRSGSLDMDTAGKGAGPASAPVVAGPVAASGPAAGPVAASGPAAGPVAASGPATSAPTAAPSSTPTAVTASSPAAAAPASASTATSTTAATAAATAATAPAPDGGTAPAAPAGAAAAASATASANAPSAPTWSRANVQDGIHYATVNPGAAAPPASAGQDGSTQPPATLPASPAVAPPPVQAVPISLDHPTVVDTGTLKTGDVTVSLYGIEGIQGEAAENMQGFLAANSGRVTCQEENTAGFVCLLPDGTDVAEVALVNGAAQVKDDAPPAYQDQQAAAQAARRGIWADLPPPPATLQHPAVQDTATLVSDGQTYRLDGIIGLGAPYAQQLQGYIQANGDVVTCMPQGGDSHYMCVMADGTDLAKVALVNGAARVAPDAPDAYRVQQGLALSNHRGLWLNPPQDVLLAMSTVQPVPVCCALEAGDDGADGITYVGGVPEAVIDGAPVFLVFAGGIGWGYYDHFHHWHGAPDRFRRHLEHFHPEGHGLRGYGHEEALRRDEALRHDAVLRGDAARRDAAFHHEAALHAEAGHPGAMAHAGPAGFHPGPAGGFRPGMPSGVRPGMPGGVRPGMAGMPHPAGGFVHPGPSLGGFHPAGAAGFHPAAAPAAHVASTAGGGKKH